jgi:hypothetical protein
MTSSFPIATVFNVVKEIQTQVKLAKVNRTLCKRVASEMEALEVEIRRKRKGEMHLRTNVYIFSNFNNSPS